MEIIEAIKSRRSVREFTAEDVSDVEIAQILEAGRWAPSGLNNQAWRFIIVRDKDTKKALSGFTHYGKTILDSAVGIVVFLDRESMYDYTKDVQSIGACIQNMLLAIHSMGLGAVWLGEILKNREKVNQLLGAPESCELMAVIAAGKPVEKPRSSSRKELAELTFREKFGNKW
ncbi:MAG: nitroreductase family protein [Candidatus Methanoperedens sp.]|nr:nitroreductase family protein [Candidatus Methanoperedens sp.]